MPKRSARDAQTAEFHGGEGENSDGGSSSATVDGRKRRYVDTQEPDPEARENVTSKQSLSDPDESVPGDLTEVDASPILPASEPPTGYQDSKVDPNLIQFDELELEKYSKYKMNHSKRGIALIFNNENFLNPTLKKRSGAAEDGLQLQATLNVIGFDVRLRKDLKLDDVWKEITQVAKEDHEDYDCLLVVFITHGEDEDHLFATDYSFKVEQIVERFTSDRVPSLAGKPKIFLFQACRGTSLSDSSVVLGPGDETDATPVKCFCIPTIADFLFLYLSMKGCYSWRNPSEGSWFIQDFARN